MLDARSAVTQFFNDPIDNHQVEGSGYFLPAPRLSKFRIVFHTIP